MYSLYFNSFLGLLCVSTRSIRTMSGIKSRNCVRDFRVLQVLILKNRKGNMYLLAHWDDRQEKRQIFNNVKQAKKYRGKLTIPSAYTTVYSEVCNIPTKLRIFNPTSSCFSLQLRNLVNFKICEWHQICYNLRRGNKCISQTTLDWTPQS